MDVHLDNTLSCIILLVLSVILVITKLAQISVSFVLSVIVLELCITKEENHLLCWYMRMSVLHSDLSKYEK